jgi:hypothetical protein
MAERAPKQILSLSSAAASPDGTAISFTLETSDGPIPLFFPSVDLGELLAFFGHAARAVGDMVDAPGPPKNDLVPIPASGMGFQAGRTPDTTLLVMNLSGFGLAFEVESSDLVGMADDLGQTLRTLSAGGRQRQ